MNSDGPSRRRFLGACATALAAGVAGCNAAPGESDVTTSERKSGRSGGSDKPPGTATPQQTPAPSAFEELDAETTARFTTLYRQMVASVVEVRIYTRNASASGTGFVYDDDNHLVTNQHVVENATDVYVRFKQSGWKRADVVGTDVYSDLAVLSVDSTPDEADPLPLRRTDPAIGTKVMAIGNPYGFSGSATTGIISGVNRTLDAPNNFSIPDAIQTDAPVNPGNSGGPLVTLDGKVAGVINSGGGDNIGFAISASLLRRVAPELIADGDYDHSYMGVGIYPVSPLIAAANDIENGRGVYIDAVREGGPSDGVLQGSTGTQTVNGRETPTGGDVVVRMDDTAIPTSQALSSFLALQTRPGDTITVEVLRDGRRKTVELTLGSRPEP